MKTLETGSAVAATSGGATITRAQLREAVDDALATIESVRALVEARRWRHNERVLHRRRVDDDWGAAVQRCHGKIDVDSEEQRRLQRAIRHARRVIGLTEDLVEGPHDDERIPISIFSGALTMLEGILRADAGEDQ
jgi:hypothetical protein